MSLIDTFISAKKFSSDINELLDTIHDVVVELNAKSIIELGVRQGYSTIAFLYGLEKTGGKLWSCDIAAPGGVSSLLGHPQWTFVQADDTTVVKQAPNDVDILFIDTSHYYEHTLFELENYAKKVSPTGVILMHDVSAPYWSGQHKALQEFLLTHPEYSYYVIPYNNGLGLLSKQPLASLASKFRVIQANTINVDIAKDSGFPGYQHGDGLVFEEGRHGSYGSLAKDLCSLFVEKGFTNILELGSGAGNLSWHLRKYHPGLLVVTLDANYESVSSPYINKDTHFTVRTDVDFLLTVDGWNRPIQFDAIISYEHFEHIQEQTFDVLIANMKKHAHADTVFYGNASIWKYADNKVHCNVKSKEEWDKYLRSKGLAPLGVKILKSENKPFNFELETSIKYPSVELVYKVL